METLLASLSTTRWFLAGVELDSLDMVELLMTVEEELDMPIPVEESDKFRSVGDVIDYLLRNLPE
jgi:acyl carrier protein